MADSNAAQGEWRWDEMLQRFFSPTGSLVHPRDLFLQLARADHTAAREHEARSAELEAALRWALSTQPPWVKDVPEGLDPTFYGTGSAAGDRLENQRWLQASALLTQQQDGGQGR